jgi:hypothetical protein
MQEINVCQTMKLNVVQDTKTSLLIRIRFRTEASIHCPTQHSTWQCLFDAEDTFQDFGLDTTTPLDNFPWSSRQ